jgi:transcriptional regulator with PAS, ATPase and Fis domain
VRVDVRFVAATNVELEPRVAAGLFRKDLYYRLEGITLTVPPLRERPGDVTLLARHFLERYAARFHRRLSGFTPEATRKLEEHDWPGNVRELRNAIELVVLLEDEGLVRADSLVLGRRATQAAAVGREGPIEEDLDMGRIELRALVRALERGKGNVSAAARLLGVSRDTVRYRMRRHGVRVETRVLVDPPAPAEP